MSHKDLKDYFSDFNKDNPIRSKSFLNQNIEKIQKRYSIHGIGRIGRETIFEAKLRNNLKNLAPNKYLISNEDISKYRDSFQEFGILVDNNAKQIRLRNLPKINNDEYEAFKNSIIDKESLDNFHEFLNTKEYDFESPDCDYSVGGIASLDYFVISKGIEDQYDILKPYINNYREINGDGNCFYRSVIFRYLEILILNNKIDILQNVTKDIYNSFNSEELKSRLIVYKNRLDVKLTIKILILIIDLLKKGDIISAHKILIKCLGLCTSFDYSLIFYLRYILYIYIKENEDKEYNDDFLIKNLLPFDYYDDYNYNFDGFYEVLLKFYSFAEQIVIFLTPYVLGIPLNVIILDINNEENKKTQFKWKQGKGLNITDEITVIFDVIHYEIGYTKNDFDKIDKIYKNIFLDNKERLKQNQEKLEILNNQKNDVKENIKINKKISSDNENINNKTNEKSKFLNDIKNQEKMEEEEEENEEELEEENVEEKENVDLSLKQKEKKKERKKCCGCF